MNYDYTFFEQSLHKLRKLRSCVYDVSFLLDAPGRLFPDLDLGMAPRLLSETGGTPLDEITENYRHPPERVILTRSYARKPGRGVKLLEDDLRNMLPEDYRQFLETYDEALVTTRTYPIHLWNMDRIIEGIRFWRDIDCYPLRFIRIGEYWNLDSLYFGLWQSKIDSPDWCVVIAEWGNRDQDYDVEVSPEYILAPSFHSWLKKLIESDGLPDPYMEIGPDGGFLDPA